MSTGWGPFDKQPNILIIMTDQQRTPQHFPAGWCERNLPWLTHLQRTGVSFNRGMASSTACSPSRSALFTGTYPTINGVLKVNDTLMGIGSSLWIGGTLTSLGQVMQDAGYRMAYKGKWHLDDDFNQASETRPSNPDQLLIEDDAMTANWSMPGWTSPDLGTVESGIGTKATATGHYSTLNSLGGGSIQNDSRVVNGSPDMPSGQQSAVDFLKNYDPANDPPFCMVVSMANPHDVWVYPYSYQNAGYTDPQWLTADYRGFELPQSYFQSKLSTKPDAQGYFRKIFQGGRLDEADALSYVQFYAYLQTLVDSLTGDLIQAMQNNKYGAQLECDTVVVRLADHGEMAMAQGGLRQKENQCYNETILVPVIFSNPLLPQGVSLNHLVSLIDVLPTLAEIAGIADPGDEYTLQGKSFAASLLDPKVPTSDSALFTTDDLSGEYTSIRAVVQQDYKYAVYYVADYPDADTDPDGNPNGTSSDWQYELYDYTQDGGWLEINNLLNDPGSSINDLWQSLHDSLTELLTDSSTKPDNWPTEVGSSTPST